MLTVRFFPCADVVAKGVISREQAALTANRVWTYANKKAEDPETWHGGGIMVEMYQVRVPSGREANVSAVWR